MSMWQTTGAWLANNASGAYLFLAVLGTVVFVIQFIMTVAGFDHAIDAGGDPDAAMADGTELAQLNFFSLKSIVSFFTFFGWAGYFWGHLGWIGLGCAFGLGAAMMAGTALLFYGMMRLQNSGNLGETDFIGKTGTVYLGVAPDRGAGGRVTVRLPSCTREVGAVADEAIPTGTPVVVVAAVGADCFLVKRI